jgi:hypothetical protein
VEWNALAICGIEWQIALPSTKDGTDGTVIGPSPRTLADGVRVTPTFITTLQVYWAATKGTSRLPRDLL